MEKKEKIMLGRIIATVILLVGLEFVPLEGWHLGALYVIPYLVIGYDILRKAWKGIRNGEFFDESFLMAIATLGAMVMGEYREAAGVMLFYQIGEMFQRYAVGKSRGNIAALMDLRPDYANVEVDGQITQVDPDEVEVGTLIVVQPGEKIPIDGRIVGGRSTLDLHALTGESLPREVAEGEEVLSGSINLSGVLRIETTKEADESTAAKILDLVENSSMKKSRSENFITRFSRVYTPAVCAVAIFLAVGVPLIRMGAMHIDPMWSVWIERAFILLVISCPCALVISVPLTFFAGIGSASANGVLVKGSNYLEALSHVDTVVFDKTGTLTKGVFDVTAVHPSVIDRTELLHLTAHVERYSKHPIANSLRAAYPNEADDCRVEEVEEIAGHGIRAQVNGKTVCVGNGKMMGAIGADWHECEEDKTGTVIHVAIDGEYVGHVVISDVEKPHAKEAIRRLYESGVKQTVMLTGDTRVVAESVAKGLGINTVCSELLPADKVNKVEELLTAHKDSEAKVAFVGDGINDAPVLSRVDVGIAMGALGSDAAIEAADVVLMDDDPLQISLAMRIARKTIAIVKQNIVMAVGVKLACLILGAIGYANMWGAIFADVGVMVIAVLNAMRAMYVEKDAPAAVAETTPVAESAA
ncbi:MAG: cadmium-translocating P-type ATPase [Schwartzia sp.]|nr:cadmium-translocating P-type ATPase [Schwartzia sp. (in: firmicutes)]